MRPLFGPIEALKHHPLLHQHLALKHSFLVVLENDAILCVDVHLASAWLPQKELVYLRGVFGLDAVGVISIVFGRSELMVGDLSEGIVLEFLQLGVDTPTAELEDYPCVFLLRGGLLVPYQDS